MSVSQIRHKTETVDSQSLHETAVSDNTVITLLNNIYKELRIMNIQLSMITDNEITHAEID